MCMPNSAKDPNIYIYELYPVKYAKMFLKHCIDISNIDKGIHTTVHKYVCTKLLIMQQKTIRGIYNYP